MWQFAAGFGIALLGGVAFYVLLARRKPATTERGKDAESREIEELSKLTGELAHEIKNPLSTIKVNLKLISEELESQARLTSDKNSRVFERTLRKTAVIRKEADRLEQILDGFLRYADRQELERADVDLNELISDMVDFYSPQCYSQSITVRRGLYDEPLVCRVDAEKLKQVILNLFINAHEAMSAGGELIVQTVRQNENAVIQISDTGIGIELDRLPHIFDAYYSSRPFGGGLGLPTTKKIVEAHDGVISVNSEPGKGTSFSISLPLAFVKAE